MSLIFDGFPSKQKAEAYVAAVRKLGLKADVWESGQELNEAGMRAMRAEAGGDVDPTTNKICDVFPFGLRAPIAVVQRFVNESLEIKAETMVEKFGGEFAGT